MKRLPVLAVLPVLVAMIGAVLVGAGATPAQAADASSISATAHRATNQARRARGIEALEVSRCLARYADAQAARLAAADSGLVHQDLGPVLSGCGLRGAGENLASGFSTGRSVVKAWMASPGHRANILRTSFRREAIGAARSASGTWYAAQVFGR